MKRSALLINTSRGPVINENDLANAIINNEIAGAGLDVMTDEPPMINNPLLKLSRCVITPHHAWATQDARKGLIRGIYENIIAFIDGSPINSI